MTIRALGWMLLGSWLLAGCAARMSANTLPSNISLPAGVAVPNDTRVSIYLPQQQRDSRFFVGGTWIMPGKMLDESVAAVSGHFFPNSRLVNRHDDPAHGLLIALHPEWQFEEGSIRITLQYSVYGVNDAPLLKGEQRSTAKLGNLASSDGFYNAALRASQLMMVDLLTQLKPDGAKFPPSKRYSEMAPERLINRDQPVSTGTAFFINAQGQALTAAHVLDDCLLVEARHDGRPLATRLLFKSALLDLAVVETGMATDHFLAFRRGFALQLGEPVINVGYPLQSILAGSPNLTRGNLSSRSALEGALGQFQFSAGIQPGNSGGPVVSEAGELLGVTVGTLNPAPLAERGLLPQNVNFALDARYAAAFLDHHRLSYGLTNPGQLPAFSGAEAALQSVLSIACYQ